jgi:hypothetical protein
MKKLTLILLVALAFTSCQKETISPACEFGQCEVIDLSTNSRCLKCVSNKGDKRCWDHNRELFAK